MKAESKIGRREMVLFAGAAFMLGALYPRGLMAASKYALTDVRGLMAADNPSVLFDAAKCVQCGYVAVGADAPKFCPVCGKPIATPAARTDPASIARGGRQHAVARLLSLLAAEGVLL